jgi:mRNA-degrading endonuclease RelE of RelBE toxin-antitoxin system
VSHTVIISQEATKAIDRLDRTTERRIQARLDELSLTPYSDRISKPVIMVQGLRVSRVGDWRLFFLVDDTDRNIFITAVYHRKEAYKKLN